MKPNLLVCLFFMISLPLIAGGEIQYQVACEHFVQNNYKEAFYWYNEAANEGNIEALYSIGACYFNGYGVTLDQQEAFVWYQKAADKEHILAQYIIAFCYYKGYGVKQNFKKAAYWYQKAAERGLPVAQMSLAGCYYLGDGVKRDYNKALYWWTRAAEQGNVESQYLLAESYDMGQIIETNHKEAFKWYKKAAELGHAEAQYKLGKYYLEGKGVQKNIEQAQIWWGKASKQGHLVAEKSLQKLVSNNISDQAFPALDWSCVVPYSDKEMIDLVISKRNLLFFRFESEEEIRFQGQPINIADIREIVKEFIKNENDNYDLPKPLYRQQYENGKTFYIRYTNYFICLVKDVSVNIDNPLVRYALHEIIEAIAELRAEYCQKYYGVEYTECNIYQREILDEVLPCKIRFGNHQFTPPPPPPPAVELPDVLDIEESLSDEMDNSFIPNNNENYEEVIFIVVEQMPEFPGGQQAMMKFISENLQYPVAAQENGIQGRVICQFVINRDGSIVDVIVVRSAGDQYLDNEAIRIIKSMPKWIPGKQKGKPVRVKYTIPINFRLTDDKK